MSDVKDAPVFPAPGTVTRWDTPSDTAAVDALPKKAAPLMHALRTAGWQWLVGWSVDSGGSAFVTVKGRQGPLGHAPEITLTWHTRETGTLRLFGCIGAGWGIGGGWPRGWADLSLSKTVALIEAHPAVTS